MGIKYKEGQIEIEFEIADFIKESEKVARYIGVANKFKVNQDKEIYYG